MAQAPENHGKAWKPADEAKLRDLANRNTPTGLIAHHLGRTGRAVYSHASDIGLSLRPVNQSPYNRRDKR